MKLKTVKSVVTVGKQRRGQGVKREGEGEGGKVEKAQAGKPLCLALIACRYSLPLKLALITCPYSLPLWLALIACPYGLPL
jgi:hypothetical protein